MTTTKQVLLVENLPVIQHAVRKILSPLDVNMTVADNGKQALSMIAKHDYDLVLMDIGLPDMKGDEIAHQIRTQEDNHHHLPIVALTANQNENDHHHFLDFGIDEVMVKPINMNKANTLLTKYLQ